MHMKGGFDMGELIEVSVEDWLMYQIEASWDSIPTEEQNEILEEMYKDWNCNVEEM